MLRRDAPRKGDLCANAEKMLESRDKNYFSILVNSDMVVFLLYDGDANKIREILGIAGAPVATHRNRPLKLYGTISSNLIRAGNKFSLDFLSPQNGLKAQLILNMIAHPIRVRAFA